ncbi:MAG: NifU family protein [Bacilli bacterium]|nr:NifU family protein [Bacilli bacterium]
MTKEKIEELLVKVLGEGAEIVHEMLGGMMNISYLVKDKNDKKYIIYIPTEQANEMVDRPLEKEHQRIIYELGLTSKNVYFDEKAGIKINEFIEGDSLDKIAGFDYDKIATIFHKLHNSVMLSRVDYAPFTRFINEYEKEALQYEEPSQLYKELRDFLFSKRNFLESQPLVLSHNDAQRSNIVKTPNDEYYFIDFEFVGNNDEIYDIAAFGNGTVTEGRKLLEKYYNNNPSDNEIRRFYLWRIYISLQWYNVAITKHYRGEGEKHGFNFLDVANHFLTNAKDAYDGYHLEIKDQEVEDDTVKLIISTLDKVRHFLRKDGGDCEFISFNDGIVYVRMQGACQGCSFAYNDIKDLVEVILQEEVPGVVEVRLAD